jgi:hypothetical protein
LEDLDTSQCGNHKIIDDWWCSITWVNGPRWRGLSSLLILSALGRFGMKETHGCSNLCFYPSIVLSSIKWIAFLCGTTEQQSWRYFTVRVGFCIQPTWLFFHEYFFVMNILLFHPNLKIALLNPHVWLNISHDICIRRWFAQNIFWSKLVEHCLGIVGIF